MPKLTFVSDEKLKELLKRKDPFPLTEYRKLEIIYQLKSVSPGLLPFVYRMMKHVTLLPPDETAFLDEIFGLNQTQENNNQQKGN